MYMLKAKRVGACFLAREFLAERQHFSIAELLDDCPMPYRCFWILWLYNHCNGGKFSSALDAAQDAYDAAQEAGLDAGLDAAQEAWHDAGQDPALDAAQEAYDDALAALCQATDAWALSAEFALFIEAL